MVQRSVLCHNAVYERKQIIGMRRKCMRLIIDRDVPVEMRDGTVLRADVYRPESDAPWPVLLQRTPYDKNVPRISAPLLGMKPASVPARG